MRGQRGRIGKIYTVHDMKKLIASLTLILFVAVLNAQHTNSYTYPFYIGKAGTSTGSITLYGTTSGTVQLTVPDVAGTGTVFKLPSSNGTSGYVLRTDGAGVLSWIPLTGYATLASPTFTGTVTVPSPFTLGSTSVTSTGTQLNYLSGATGTTGTGSVVLSASPTLTGTLGAANITATGGIQGQGEFNIIQYGAISNDGISDAAAIQAAINAAYATTVPSAWWWTGYGGKVIIPPGIWYIDVADTLKSYINVEIANGARFEFPVGFTGCMWTNPTNKKCTYAMVRGGTYHLPVSFAADFIKLYSTINTEYYVSMCTFENMNVNRAYRAIYIDNVAPGWCTNNIFNNISTDSCQKVVVVKDGGANKFNDFTVECRAITDTIFNIQSNHNTVKSCMIWDYVGDEVSHYIGATNYRNYLDIPNQQNGVNAGIYNIVIGHNKITSDYYDVTGAGDPGEINFKKRKTTAWNVVNGDYLGEINFKGWHTSNYYTGATIEAKVGTTPGVSDMPTQLIFSTTPDGSATPVERMIIGTTGSIQVDTTFRPMSNDGGPLGQSGYAWSDLWLASGAKTDYDAGDVTLTHSANTLTLGGGNLALGANNLTMTGSIASDANRVTKGWFTDIDVTNDVEIEDVAISGSIVKVTIGWDGAAGCDFVWTGDAGHGQQNLDIGSIVPANADVIKVDIVCTEALVGCTDMNIGAGNASGGAQYVAAASLDALNEVITSTAVLTDAVLMNYAAATKVWISGDPSDNNWSDMTAGKWTVYVTYVYYGDL